MESLKKYSIPLNLLLVGVIILLFLTKSCGNSKLKKELELQAKLTKALTDTISVKTNKYKELEYSKLSIQYNLKDLEDDNIQLTKNQIELVERVENQDKNFKTISAALVEIKAEVRNIKNSKPTSFTDSSVTFSETKDTNLIYDIEISNVKPITEKGKTPTLLIKNIELPNKQFVDFYWGDKKDGYPVSFSISNSNPYYKVSNIDSYVIPSIDKETVDPSFMEKVKKSKTFKYTRNILLLGVGFWIGDKINN